MENRIDALVQAIGGYRGKPIKLMEVCGTHTYQISHLGISGLLPENIQLVSGPGCPVCVTPAGYIHRAMKVALEKDTTLCSFGDMIRVPGTEGNLAKVKAQGGSVKVMYSPMDVVTWAKNEPQKQFVVAAVGFETTLPLYALLIQTLEKEKLTNVRLLMAVKRLMPGLQWLCENEPDIQGFIGPGHVSAILGYEVYESLCEKYRVPLTVAGFSYEHLVAAIHDLVRQIEKGAHEAHNLYPKVVTKEGNPKALELIHTYFEPTLATWRGLGAIAQSGYGLKKEFSRYDGGTYSDQSQEPKGCQCANVITGRKKPVDCALFGQACTPLNPVGPCMVSSEGSCGIWYQNARTR